MNVPWVSINSEKEKSFVLFDSGNAAWQAKHFGIPNASRRWLLARRRGNPSFRRSAPTNLVQWLSIPGNSAEFRQPSSFPSRCNTDHQGYREIRQKEPSSPLSGDFYLKAHVRRATGVESVRGNEYLFPGNIFVNRFSRLFLWFFPFLPSCFPPSSGRGGSGKRCTKLYRDLRFW